MADQPKMTDVQTLRKRARQHIEAGAMTEGYKADRVMAVKLLNDAIGTELVNYLRYKNHQYMADGLASASVADTFDKHAHTARQYADRLAERIVELDGKPDLNPAGLGDRSYVEYVECASLADMIRENLIAERIIIDGFREMVNYFEEQDMTSRRLMEDLLEAAEARARDLQSLFEQHCRPQQQGQGGQQP